MPRPEHVHAGLRLAFARLIFVNGCNGATHLDFTDDAVVLPLLKWIRMLGPISTARMIEITNAVELRFFDAYLRGGPKPRFDEFPELPVEMNAAAAR